MGNWIGHIKDCSWGMGAEERTRGRKRLLRIDNVKRSKEEALDISSWRQQFYVGPGN